MNHKRKRPKHQRAGCLHCKAQKDERAAKVERVKPGGDQRRETATAADLKRYRRGESSSP